MEAMESICGDNRFEIIKKAKEALLQETNIESSADEMKVLDTFLFRCWQMGWLKKYDDKQMSFERALDGVAQEYYPNNAIAAKAFKARVKHIVEFLDLLKL